MNRFVVGAMILSEPVIGMLKRELRKLSDGINIEESEISTLLREGVIRRDLLEGEDANAAFSKVARHLRHQTKRPAPKKGPATSDNAPSALPEQSLSDQILAETKTAEIAHSV